MKPPRFEYVAATSLAEAIEAKSSYEDPLVLAGGQSLIPTLNFRLAKPDALIDLSRVPGLDAITVDDQWIHVGAMVRQRDLELHGDAHAANPLVRETLGHVAHAVVRNRGTVGGSIAHADAAAELPALLVALGGEVTVRGPSGERVIAADDLFEFHLTTTLAPEEVLTEVRFPRLTAGSGGAFDEFARRHGDYAIAGVAAVVTVTDGVCTAARLAACGVGNHPVRLTATEAALVGQPLDGTVAAAGDAAREHVTAVDDHTTTQAYRKHLLAGLVRRAVTRAAGAAGGGAG